MPTREKTFQRYIIDKLVNDNKYIERKAKTDYNKPYALDLGMLTEFLECTQPDKMKQLEETVTYLETSIEEQKNLPEE